MGVGNVPAWCNVLEAAKEWGVPPWEVVGEKPQRTKWYLRWLAYRGEANSVATDKANHG